MNNSSVYICKIQCPKCAVSGEDKGKKTLAVYSDGHAYCFACSHLKRSNTRQIFKRQLVNPKYIPILKTTTLPEEAIAWLKNRNITQQDIEKHGLEWVESLTMISTKTQKPYDITNRIAVKCEEGYLLRSISPNDKIKALPYKNPVCWYSKKRYNSIVFVEDVFSAMHVNHVEVDTISLNGTTLSKKIRLWLLNNKILDKYDKFYIWLDGDVAGVVATATVKNWLKQFVDNVQIIYTKLDPKYIQLDEIKNLLENNYVEKC